MISRTTTYLQVFLLFLLPTAIIAQTNSGQSSQMELKDFQTIIGKWNGSLTYMDYQTGNPYTMKANLRVVKGRSPRQLVVYNEYPGEPGANSKSKFRLSKNRKKLNRKTISTRAQINAQEVKITTEHKGKDNRKKALVRNIYIIGAKTFINRKEVKYMGTDEWITRNEYSFQRAK